MNTCSVDFDSEIVIIPDGVEMIDYDFISKFKNLKKIILPNTLKYIDNETFKNCTTLEEISIPDSIEQIGYEAFSGCSSLKNINLPNKYFYIQPYAFSNCTSLTQFTLPSEITYFSEGLLSGCINLEKINCSDKITYIDNYTLYNCHKLKDFKISKYTSHIGEFAMFGCDSISKISIPKNTDRIGLGAFAMMKSLKKIMVDSGNKKYKNVHNMLIDKDGQCILQYAIASLDERVSLSTFYDDPVHDLEGEEFDILSRCESIADYAFAGAKNIKEMDVFSSLESFGINTFLDCDNLERLNFVFYNFGRDISVSIPTLGHDKTDASIPFKKIYLDNSITVIGGRNTTFFQNAEYVFLPFSIEQIHYGAFSLSKNLKRLVIPRDIKVICPDSFNDNTRLSLPFFKDDIEAKDLFFMISTYGDDFRNKMDINFCVMKDGTYYVKANDEIYFKIKIEKNYYDTKLSDLMKLKEEILYSPSSVQYDLVNMLELNLDELYKLCRKCLNGVITNDDLNEYLTSNPNIEQIEAESYSIIYENILKKYGIEDENFASILNGFTFPIRDIYEYCENYSKTMSMFFKYGDVLNFCKRYSFEPSHIINYCKLLEKYNIKDRLLYNPAFFIQIYDEDELELFLSKYNKNIKHILINSNALDNNGENLVSVFNMLECTGGLSDDSVFAQKVQTFFNEKVFGTDSKYRVLKDKINETFGDISRNEVDCEFGKFFMDNYEELFKLNLKHPGIIVEIFNIFPKLQARATSNKGSQRQLKVTIRNCIDYLLIGDNNDLSTDKEKLAVFLKDYFHECDVVDGAYRLICESKNAPRNIFTNDEEADLCEGIGSYDFTYEWLPKQSWDNLILGKRCNCCSHVIGAGAGITRASMVRDDCQNLVIRNKNGEIVAKMTIYVNKEQGYGVFNTAEVNLNYRDDEVIKKIYEAFMRGCNAFTEEYNKNNITPISVITMGEYRNVLKYELGNIETDILDTPNYSDYAYFVNRTTKNGENHDMVGQYDGDSKEGQILVYKKGSKK